LVALEEARAKKPVYQWTSEAIARPEFLGVRAFNVSIDEIAPFIDWSPFFWSWQMKGKFPQILEHEKYGAEAKKLYADAQKLLAEMSASKRIQPKAVVGFWPANSEGDDVILYKDESRKERLAKFHF